MVLKFGRGSAEFAFFLLSLVAFIPLMRMNFLLFHIAIEFLAIFVSFGIFAFYYNTRKFDVDGIYQILGVSYLFVGITDFFHTMTYEGMNVMAYSGHQETISLWLFARAIEVCALFVAPYFYNKSINFTKLLLRTGLLYIAFVLLFIKYYSFLPELFIEGVGLTRSKILIEYIFCLILIFPIWKIHRLKGLLDSHSRKFLILAIIFTILSELSFTLYVDLYGVMNAVGHMLKIVSFYYIYKAMIDVTIQEPLSTLFGKLSDEKNISLVELERTRSLARKNFKELFDYKRTLDQGFIVFMIDQYGRVIKVNKNLCELSGVTEREIQGELVSDVIHGTDIIDLTLKKRELYVFKNPSKKGNTFWLSGVMTPFLNEEGEVKSFLYVGHDITKHKEQEELLIKNQKMTAIGEATSQILHDMMNPLTIIHYSNESLKGYFQKLQETETKEMYLEKVALIEESYDRMTNFFQGFRKQLQADLTLGNEFYMSHVALVKIVHKALKFCDFQINKYQIDLKIEIDDQILLECYDHQLTQVFVNLISNSIDAIRELDQRWIQLSYEKRLDQHIIKVTDSGSGIPIELQSKIFSHLFTTKQDTGGTGLGMGICRAIVEAHRGQLILNTQSAHTEFWVLLPV